MQKEHEEGASVFYVFLYLVFHDSNIQSYLPSHMIPSFLKPWKSTSKGVFKKKKLKEKKIICEWKRPGKMSGYLNPMERKVNSCKDNFLF